MTHASLELKRLQDAFEKWASKRSNVTGDMVEDIACEVGMESAAALFWPFVAHVLNDPTHSAERTALLNRFKHALGMELMAHEMVGLILESKGPVK